MSNYSYDDMLRMQSEAKKRVMEMQKRSRDAAVSFNSASQQDKSKSASFSEELPRVPKAISFPAELHRDSQSRKTGNTEGRGLSGLRSALDSVFGNLSPDDYEKMFILSLCLLLAKERGDDSLIFSLMYLLT